jgi:hypothetical protein
MVELSFWFRFHSGRALISDALFAFGLFVLFRQRRD